MNFRSYLNEVGITRKLYINRMLNLLQPYLNFLKEKNLTIYSARYEDLIDFIGWMQKEDKSKFHINRTLQTISHYYQYKEVKNIAQNTRLRGLPRSQPQNLLSSKELDQIYENFISEPCAGIYHYSDKIILGMIIYQALDMREFMTIELRDLKLEKGLIYIGSGRFKQERYIPLKANQVLELDRFIREIRPNLLKEDSLRLFSPQAEDYNLLHWQFKQFSKKVKDQMKEKLDLEIDKLSQLRHSRIALWVKEEGLRKAQYLAGFRRVSSAERYQKADLSDLKKQVDLFHPLG